MNGRKPNEAKNLSISLKWRIVGVLLVAALFPLALTGFGSWAVFGNLLEEKTLEQMRALVESHADAIEANLAEKRHLLELSAEASTLDELVRPGQLQRLFYNLNRVSADGFVDLGVIDSDGKHLAYVGPYDLQSRNYKDADWFKEVRLSGEYISDVFLGFRGIPHCIIAVKAGDPARNWILRATINSVQFDAIVKAESLGRGSDAYIVNRGGYYQTTPRYGTPLDRATDTLTTLHSGVQDRRIVVDGETRLQVTTWINDNRWMLAVERDLSAVQAPVTRAIVQGAYVVLVAVVILVLITFFATRHLTTRIDIAVSEREELSRAFMRSAKLASIGELTTGLAHEINNPLAVISAEQTNISDLLEGMDIDAEVREQAATSIKRSLIQVQRCAGITQKMLQFGRSQEPKLEPTDIGPRLTEITNLMLRHAKVRNVEIRLALEEGLPKVMVDPVELEQVVVNLINNAIDALPGGGEVTVQSSRKGGTVLIEVVDTGTGIPPDNLERIFEPFFTTKPAGKGTGLGLSVCYGIVRSWGGTIEADSVPGKGTTIRILLPAQRHDRRAQ